MTSFFVFTSAVVTSVQSVDKQILLSEDWKLRPATVVFSPNLLAVQLFFVLLITKHLIRERIVFNDFTDYTDVVFAADQQIVKSV